MKWISNMFASILVWINIIGFVAYGLFCFFVPEKAASAMGFVLSNADAAIEISAMYGGVQIMIGLFCLVSMRVNLLGIRSALTILSMVYGGLVVGRIYGLLTVVGDVTLYTKGATTSEVIMFMLLSFALLRLRTQEL